MKLLCWNINGLQSTLKQIRLRFGSLESFFDFVAQQKSTSRPAIASLGEPPVAVSETSTVAEANTLCNNNTKTPSVQSAHEEANEGHDAHTEHHHMDVICLQEVKISKENLSKEVCVIPGYESFWSCSIQRKGYSGTGVYCKENSWSPVSCEDDARLSFVDSGEPDVDLSGEGRLLLLDMEEFVLINVYVPNSGQASRLRYKLCFLDALHKLVYQLVHTEKREIVLVGDFNVSLEELDVHSAIGLENAFGEEERCRFARFLQDDLLVDVWRRLHPETAEYTCFDEKTNARAFNKGVRIDYVLTTKNIASKVTSCEILKSDVIPAKYSDHRAVVVDIDIPRSTVGKGKRKPCAAWRRLYERMVDVRQPTIMSMFALKKKESVPSATQPSEKRRKLS